MNPAKFTTRKTNLSAFFMAVCASAMPFGCNNSSSTSGPAEASAPQAAGATENASSNSSYRSFLRDYEDFVDKYIAVMKKVQRGDLSAMTDSMTLMQKAQDMQQKLESYRNDMTADDLQTYLRIQKKLLGAASQLSGGR